jgi:hypothetical protein
VFRSFNLTNLAGLSDAEQYGRGDLNGDGVNNFNDFRVFEADYDAVHGGGALTASVGVPEPSSFYLAFILPAVLATWRRSPSKSQ